MSRNLAFFLWVCLLGLTPFVLAAPNVQMEEPQLIYEEDPSSLVSDFQVVIRTGSAEEPVGKQGLTNIFSELMLRGTKKYDRQKFQSTLEKMGATLTVSVSHDQIVFSGEVIKENTFEFLKLIEEALLHPKFDEKEFNSLKVEVINQIAHIKNSNNRLGGLAIRQELFKGTPIEKPALGTLSSVRKLQMPDVLRAYNSAFFKQNILFAVASPFKESQWKTALKEIWKKFPDGSVKTRRIFEPQIPEGPTLIVIHKAKTSTGVLTFAQKGITAQDPDRYVLGAGNFSFGGEPLVSRLFRTIRGELGWTYAINSGYGAMGSLSYQPGIYTIVSTPSVEFTSKTLFKTLSSWQDYVRNGLRKEELSLAQESLINSYPFEFESAQKRLGQRVYSELYGVPVLTQEEYQKTIDKIGNRDLKKALKDRHTEKGWLMTLVADKDVVAAQLAEEQKGVPYESQLKISKVITPADLIQ
ncbi:insulinase family protein [bacterium]|nr:insulinase family protein [bacterium]